MDPGARRFAAATEAITRHLPFGLDGVVAPTLVGFALINTTTFAADLLCLTALHGGVGLPVGVAVTIGYALAFGLGYGLNRVLNFRSQAPIGPQLVVYVAVVVANYLVWVLGLVTLLDRYGLDYRLSRVASAACEVCFMYLMLRFVVFRSVQPGRQS